MQLKFYTMHTRFYTMHTHLATSNSICPITNGASGGVVVIIIFTINYYT